jgi:rubredoxin
MSQVEVKRVGPKNSKGNVACLIAGTIMLPVGIVLAVAATPSDAGMVLLIIGGLIALFGGALLVGGVLETRHYHRTHCQQCGHLLEVKDMTYGGMTIKDNAGSQNQFNGATRKEDVEFDCVCPNCGATSTFTETFQTGSVDKNGTVHRNNLNAMIKKYWKYKQ